MHMHNRSVIKAVIALLPVFTACKVAEVGVSSTDRDLKISLLTSEGRAEIAVDFHGKRVIEPSRIGFVFSDGDGETVRLPLSFLGEGDYVMTSYRDAEDADTEPNHILIESVTVGSQDKVEVNMARNGGFAARISPSEHSAE